METEMKRRSLVRMLCTLGLVASSLTAFAQSSHANNITARISGGNLYIYGDKHDNIVTISSSGPGVITLDPSHGESKINGKSGNANLSGWKGGIYIYGYDGNDDFTITIDSKINGAVHVDLGQGSDNLYLGGTDIKHHLMVIGADGNDIVFANEVNVEGAATFNLGSGDDWVYTFAECENTSVFSSTVVILPGTGNDFVTLGSTDIHKNLTIDSPLGTVGIYLNDVVCHQDAFLYGSSGDDSIEVAESSFDGLLKVLARDGGDYVDIYSVVADRIETFLGSGNDCLLVDWTFADTIRHYLEGGNDHLDSIYTSFSKQYIYGGAGNDCITLEHLDGDLATIYGDGGNDTLITNCNDIDTVRVYTVENQN